MACVLTMANTAHASPSARLTYVRGDGAASCPDEDALRQAVASRLGYDPFFPSARKSVVAEVSRGDKGFRGRIVILDEHGLSRGERVLPPSGKDCGETVRAMALAISIAIDDLAAEDPKAPEADASNSATAPPIEAPSPPIATPAPSSPPSPVASAPAPAPSQPPTPLELRAAAGPHVGIAFAPSVDIGGHLSAELLVGRFAIGVEGRIDAPASATLATGGRVETSYAGGALLGCVRGGLPFACATVGAGSLTGRSDGITFPRTDRALLFLGGVRVGIEGALGERIVLRGFGAIEVPIPRHEVQVDGVTRFELPIVAGLLGADVALRFY